MPAGPGFFPARRFLSKTAMTVFCHALRGLSCPHNALTVLNGPCDNGSRGTTRALQRRTEQVGMADDQKRSHTLADHLLGQDIAHEHDGNADHDHDHFEVDADERIDDAALGTVIDDAYKAAGVQPQDIDTGVVILTGEALRRENAEAIAALLAEQRGDFVTAAAGHHMESMLAAY